MCVVGGHEMLLGKLAAQQEIFHPSNTRQGSVCSCWHEPNIEPHSNMFVFASLCFVDCTAVTFAHGEVANIGLVHVSPHRDGQPLAVLKLHTEHTAVAILIELFHFAAHAVDISILLAHILGDAQLQENERKMKENDRKK